MVNVDTRCIEEFHAIRYSFGFWHLPKAQLSNRRVARMKVMDHKPMTPS